MKTFLLILGIVLFGMGVRGTIVGLVHGSAGSFLFYKGLPDDVEIYANIALIIMSLFVLGVLQKGKKGNS